MISDRNFQKSRPFVLETENPLPGAGWMTPFIMTRYMNYILSSCYPITMSVKELTRQIFRQFVDSFDTILFDCDGVLWQGNEVISKAPDVIRRLRDLGKQPLFVTNNSTKSRSQYIEKFNKLGFQVSENEIFCTAYLAAIYMRNILKFDGKAYLMGSPGLEEEFKLFNINYTGAGPDPTTGNVEWTKTPLDPEIGAVVVGFDRDLSYNKLLKAASYLRDPSIPFIATNMDSCLPVRDSGYLVPGTGAIVSAVEMAAGRKPLVLGKPHKYMVDLIRENRYTLDPKRTVMVGDRLNTDILLGKNSSLQTLMVLTGVSTLAEVEENTKSTDEETKKLVPDYYIESLTEFSEILSEI
ncbi:Glycerol-3-phosphate phosphatase [Holothuria leucospilota]|uniref:Glycerol-3-phosphate phosphatase n=1 Tax=Holothuria leucospilota TaxID=206669 RepID=A0A9Q0YLQ9_HOLLE|nr:Glycerol-3-phosphate phosphatase [Holothuria leucospilota]